MSATPFLETLANRRTIYALKKESPISDARIQEIVSEVIKHIPSSFNSQTTRAVLLLHGEHDKLWEFHREALKPLVPEENWAATNGKIDMFKGAYATILFFDDIPSIQAMQNAFPPYADKFPGWATDSNGAHQISTWAALEAEGLGANLQHYDPLVNAKIQSAWNLPTEWSLKAELVIGTPAAPAGEKTYKQIAGERLLVFGA